MANDSTKGVNNVIKGPWSKAKIITKSQTDKIADDMVFVDDVAESVMIPMIHGLSENGLDIKSDKFVQEVGFMNEVVKSLVFRHLGYGHPMTTLIGHTMNVKEEETRDTYAKFDMDALDRILDDIFKEDEENEPDPA